MKTYHVMTYRQEESEKVMNVLNKHEVVDIKREKGIVCYESIGFHCAKQVWKNIKNELNLTVTSVFSKIKIEP